MESQVRVASLASTFLVNVDVIGSLVLTMLPCQHLGSVKSQLILIEGQNDLSDEPVYLSHSIQYSVERVFLNHLPGVDVGIIQRFAHEAVAGTANAADNYGCGARVQLLQPV